MYIHIHIHAHALPLCLCDSTAYVWSPLRMLICACGFLFVCFFIYLFILRSSFSSLIDPIYFSILLLHPIELSRICCELAPSIPKPPARICSKNAPSIPYCQYFLYIISWVKTLYYLYMHTQTQLNAD